MGNVVSTSPFVTRNVSSSPAKFASGPAVPSGAKTGLKIFVSPAIDVTGGLTSDLILDFDVEKSFIAQGHGEKVNGFLFKPVIRATNTSVAGRLAGGVTDTSAAAIANARIWAEQDSVIANSYSDASGNYVIMGLSEGTYTANATATGYDTVSVSVDITAGSQTSADFELTPQ